ncbi:unnamed protein product, partial [Amoebophrya sp. A120]
GLAIREKYLDSWDDAQYWFHGDEDFYNGTTAGTAGTARTAGGTTTKQSNPKDSTAIHYHHFGMPIGPSAEYA